MGTKGKTWTSATDSSDQIQMCLNCQRLRCVDCIGRRLPNGKETYIRKSPGYKNRMLNATAKEVIRLYRTAKNDRDIAEQLGRPLSTVTSVRRKFNLPPARTITEEARGRLVDEWLGEGEQGNG